MSRPRVRGRVFQDRRLGMEVWVYVVYQDDRIVATDWTGNWNVIYDACRHTTEAVATMSLIGHTLGTYASLVDALNE